MRIRGRGALSKGAAKLSKVADYFHLFPSANIEEKVKQAGGRVTVEVELDEAGRPLTIHLTPSQDGDHELKKPRQGRSYIPIRIIQLGLSPKSCPAQEVKETVTEDKILVAVPPALCRRD